MEYGAKIALKLKDIQEAWLWAERAPDFKEKRRDRCEAEFLVGKVAYEAGKLDIAKEQFREAHRKSKGRLFINEDPMCRALLSE